MFILTGIIAALLAYLCNKLVLKKLGDSGIIIIIPFIEETAKTGSAIVLTKWAREALKIYSKTFITSSLASLVGTHFIFGLIEGIYDIVNSSRSIGKLAALASILSHSFFGLATYLTITAGYSVYWGILLSWLLHSSWNWYITKYL